MHLNSHTRNIEKVATNQKYTATHGATDLSTAVNVLCIFVVS